MMLQHGLSITMLLLSAGLATTGLQQGYGWLDRAVQFQKNKLFNEVKELAPINVNVDIRPRWEGYEDSRHWDFDSVLRLLSLIRKSGKAKPIHRALRRALQPSRRIMMSMKESMQKFPSIKNTEDNNFYYDADYTSAEENAAPPAPPVPEDQAVIIVSNPVEARLPSAQISVKLLRQILEARARAARQMPTTAAMIPWIEFIKNRTLTSTEAGSTDATTTKTTDHKKSTDATSGHQTTQADEDGKSTTTTGGSDADGSDSTDTQPEGETETGSDGATTGADTETTAADSAASETTPETPPPV